MKHKFGKYILKTYSQSELEKYFQSCFSGIWITQINCAEKSIVEAPGGCNQYYFGKEGIIKTFNFEGVQYLAGQNYKMCIRSEAGACYVAFEAETNHFMLQVRAQFCTKDAHIESVHVKSVRAKSVRVKSVCLKSVHAKRMRVKSMLTLLTVPNKNRLCVIT